MALRGAEDGAAPKAPAIDVRPGRLRDATKSGGRGLAVLNRSIQDPAMKTTSKLMFAITITSLLAGCMASTQSPPLTAFQSNTGPGSSASGAPFTASGSVGRPGDPVVPGVTSAGPIVR